MDSVDIFLRVCLWGSIVLMVILLFWALFGGWLSGSGKRSRPEAGTGEAAGVRSPTAELRQAGPGGFKQHRQWRSGLSPA